MLTLIIYVGVKRYLTQNLLSEHAVYRICVLFILLGVKLGFLGEITHLYSLYSLNCIFAADCIRYCAYLSSSGLCFSSTSVNTFGSSVF